MSLEQFCNVANLITTLIVGVVSWILLWIIPYKQTKTMSDCNEITNCIELICSMRDQLQFLESMAGTSTKEAFKNLEEKYCSIWTEFLDNIQKCSTKLEALSESKKDIFVQLKNELVQVRTALVTIWINLGCISSYKEIERLIKKPDAQIQNLVDGIEKALVKLEAAVGKLKNIRAIRQKPITNWFKKS